MKAKKLVLVTLVVFLQQLFLMDIINAAKKDEAVVQEVQTESVEGTSAVVEEPEEEIETFTLEKIVVTAMRGRSTIEKIPANVTVITSEDIKKKNAHSVAEALKDEVGIFYNPVAEEIQFRGRNTDNVMVLVDGVPSFFPFNSSANLDAVAMDNIERIEVVRGPGSSLYGGNAVAGVINIITKDMDKNSVNVRLGGGSNNTWIKDISAYQKVSDKFSFGLGWESRSSDGYMQRYARVASTSAGPGAGPIGTGVVVRPDGKGGYQYFVGERGNRGYDKDNIWVKFKYKFDENKSLTYSFTHFEYEGKTTGAKSYIKDAAGNPIFAGAVQLPNGTWVRFSENTFTDYINRKKVLTHGLSYRDVKNHMNLNLSFSDVRDGGYSSGSLLNTNTAGSIAQYPGKTYNLDFQKNWVDFGKHNIVAGVSARQDSLDYRNYKLSQWGNSNSKTDLNYESSGKNQSLAIFIQDDYSFNNKFRLITGLRYDNYSNKDGYSNLYGVAPASIIYPNRSYGELSPKLALEFAPDKKTSVYLSYGHSFRPPDLYQLYRISKQVNYDYVGNPFLKPETSDTFELGIKKKIGSKLKMDMALFRAKTKDAIIAVEYAPGTFPVNLDPTRTTRAYTNVENETRTGMELSARYQFDKKWSSYFNYTWQNANYTDGDATKRFYDIPRHVVHVGVNYELKRWNIGLDGSYISKRHAKNISSGAYYASYDGAFVANFRLEYKINDNATIAFGIKNLFDKEYFQNYIAPGRSFSLEASFKI